MKIATLIASETMNATYCPLTKKLRNGILTITAIEAFSTAVAVLAVIQFQYSHNSRMKGHNAKLKLWTFKTVVFFGFAQKVLFSAFSISKIYRPTRYVSYFDMSVGLNQFMISCECFLYAFIYIKAFEFSPYRKALQENHCARGSPINAILDINNPMDIIRGTVFAFSHLQNPKRHGTYSEPLDKEEDKIRLAKDGAQIEMRLGSESSV